jgi:hypothetical protein
MRHYATSRKVVGSRPDEVIEFYQLCFTISELLHEYPKIACTILQEIIIGRLDYHKICIGWGHR